MASARRCARGAAGPSAGRGVRRAAPRSARRGRCRWRAVSRGPACGPGALPLPQVRVGEQGGEAAFGGGEGLLRVADGGAGLVAGRVADQLRVLLDAGQVVADLAGPVVLAGVLEEVLFPPP